MLVPFSADYFFENQPFKAFFAFPKKRNTGWQKNTGSQYYCEQLALYLQMRGDQKIHNYLYHSSIAPKSQLSYDNTRTNQRTSLPVDQFLPSNQHPQRYQRQSNSIDDYMSNSPFAHLRSQIGHLRSQFAKLKQNDHNKNGVQIYSNRKQDKPLNHSIILDFEDESKKVCHTEPSNTPQTLKSIQAQRIRIKSEINDQFRFEKKYTFQTKKFQGQKEIKIDSSNNSSNLSMKLSELQTENQNLKTLNQTLQAQIQSLLQELQKERVMSQEMKKSHRDEIFQNMSRNQEKILELEEIHRQNISNLLQRLKESQQTGKETQLKMIELEEQNSRIQKLLTKKTQELNNQTEQIRKLQDKNEELRVTIQKCTKQIELLSKGNADCQIDVLANQKLQLIEQIHFLSQQVHLKENIIQNICRDINNQINNTRQLKIVISSNLKYIEELNQIIVNLQLQKLNYHYDDM